MKVYANAEASTVAADPDCFSGLVWRTDMVGRSAGGAMRGVRFTYAPGARSHWHVHTEEQVLVALDGRGWVNWKGGPGPQALAPGDWVHVTAGVPHWHGADSTSVFSHLAVTAGGEVHWLTPVDD